MEIINKKDIVHQDTELRLGLPGAEGSKCPANNKRSFDEHIKEESTSKVAEISTNTAPPPKAQVVGWPPVRSYRKNCLQAMKKEAELGGMYVKVSMDGAPYLRKIDMKLYNCYAELLKALEDMFKVEVGNGFEFVPTYEDKDGDWMLVGDVPWEMFINSCKRLRVMKGSEAKGLGCFAA